VSAEPNTNPGPGPCAVCSKPAVCFSVNHDDPAHETTRACGECCDHDPAGGPCDRDWVCASIVPQEAP
jgi:hypothetical protein